jgi:outer membrane cobalamin receptor
MKKNTLLFFFSLFFLIAYSNSCFSQNNTSGTIKGIVLDKTTNVPLESASVRVIKSEDSTLFKGVSTDKEGKFIVTEIPYGLYTVKINFIGYIFAVAKNVTVSSEKKVINFGTIKLEPSSELVDEINVVEEAPAMTFENGKKIYNVEKDLTAKSGSVLDLMKNIPSVDVDNEGNVSLRGGGNVKILIDGKESALLSNGNQALQNISANTVEKIEVINNPSAKYEAEGISGIVNIIIKKGQNIGYNGNVRLNTGTKDKYNFSTGSSLKKGNYCLNGNYGFWNFYNPGHSTVERTSFQSIESRTTMQDLYWYFKGIGHFGSVGADYDFDKFNTLSMTGNVFYYRSDFGKGNFLNFYDLNNNITNSLHNYNNDGREGTSIEGMLSYNKKFEEKGRDLTIQANYSRRKQDHPLDFTNYNPDNSVYYTKAEDHFTFNLLNSQADYIHPLGNESKLEGGLRTTYRNVGADYKFLILDDNTKQWLVYQNRINDIDLDEIISASYLTLSGKYKELSYELGLRGEYYYRKFSLLQGTEKYSQNYFDLFPSISLTQSINKENAIQATYSRRINRPGMYQLNPFVFQNDEYSKRTGNPYLNAEYVNSFELGYTRYLDFATLTLTGYWRNVLDNINPIKNIDTNGAVFTTFKNTGTSNTYGLEFIIQLSPVKWWNINGSANYFYNKITGDGTSFNFDNSYKGFSSRFTSNMNIPNLFDIQLQYEYEGVRLTPQGRFNPAHLLDISVQKGFLDRKLILGVRLSDIFDKDAIDYSLNTNDFSQVVFEKGNTRILYFTLSFNFGEQINSNSQRNSQRRQRDAGNEIHQ